MRSRLRALLACSSAVILGAVVSFQARADSPEQQLAREVPEVRDAAGVESPRAIADGIVRALVARFEQVAKSAAAPADARTSNVAGAAGAAGGEGAGFGAAAPEAAALEPIYRYVDRDGRVVYTNVAENVPLAKREQSKIDLRHVSLNTELGTELQERLRAEYTARVQSPVCDQLRSDLEMSPIQRLLTKHAPLVGAGALLLLFTVYAPVVLKRFGVSLWMRMLAMILPLMAIFALGGYGVDQVRANVADLRKRAEPCLTEAFASLTGKGADLARQAGLVGSLVQLGAGGGAAEATPPVPAQAGSITATGSGE